jgi:hypothetical protein
MKAMDYLPARRRIGRRRRHGVPSSPAPAALVLVSATYQEEASVTLEFDRAIDVSGIDVSAIIVDDALTTGLTFAGAGTPTIVNATTVQVTLVETGGSSGSEITLTAGANNGIVAADDGGAWPGAEDLELPYP